MSNLTAKATYKTKQQKQHTRPNSNSNIQDQTTKRRRGLEEYSTTSSGL